MVRQLIDRPERSVSTAEVASTARVSIGTAANAGVLAPSERIVAIYCAKRLVGAVIPIDSACATPLAQCQPSKTCNQQNAKENQYPCHSLTP